MNTIIKKEFIRRVLNDEASRLMRYQGLALRRYLSFHTGDTDRSRSVSVTSADNFEGKLSFTARAHVRFLDLRKGTKKVKNGRIQRTKRRPIYNSVVMKQYNGIARRLMYDFTEEVANSIKADFQST